MDGIFQELIIPKYNYWAYTVLMMVGLYAMIAKKNLVKKLIGLNIFQTAIILFYVSIGAKTDATIPILFKEDIKAEYYGKKAEKTVDTSEQAPPEGEIVYGAAAGQQESKKAADDHGDEKQATIKKSDGIHAKNYINPLPHVLMLTAIVVSVATLGVALALMLKIYNRHQTLNEDEILNQLSSE
jgi:multicomponent Na+:H+ antiporter subunit C